MAYQDLDSTAVSDLRNLKYTAGYEPWNIEKRDYHLSTQTTDTKSYICDWEKWHGIYRTIPMVKAVIDKLAVWTVGRGIKATNKTHEKIINRINGTGKDSFNTIISNAVRTYKTGGDAYIEIIRDKAGRISNLKTLDPGTIKIISSTKGFIKRYEQTYAKNFDEGTNIHFPKFQPEEIFHLPNNRIADEIHGIPLTESLQSLIKMWWQAMDDEFVIFHRYVKPLLVWKLETDDTTEIATFKAKAEQAVKNMENMYVPSNTADLERMSIPQYSTLDPLPWIKMLESHFIKSAGVPEIILGHSREESEATAKIMYLAFQQTIEWEQLFLKEQIKMQLGLDVEFEFPASIDPAILTDARKNQKGNSLTQINPMDEKAGISPA